MKYKIKVIGYKNLKKTTYETSNESIPFEVKINNIPVKGYWSPISTYTHLGVDINEIQINDGSNYPKRIKIFLGGGTNKTYEIYSRDAIKLKNKQPKDLRFTGRYYETKDLSKIFKTKMKEISEGKHDGILTKDFIKYFINN